MEIGDADNKRYLVNNVRGYLPTTIISFVMNLHPEARPIFFSRHGQSVYNLEDRIGGDSSLTEYGLQYARKLGQRIAELEELPASRLVVWTSCLKRTQETAQFIRCRHRVRWQALNEIAGGMCEDLTYKEMEERFPDIVDMKFTARMEEKLDTVEEGKTAWKDVIRDFYGGFERDLENAEKALEGVRLKVPDEVSEEKCDVCGRNMVIKSGRFGRFLACPGYPECTFTKPLVIEMPGRCPKCGGRMMKRTGVSKKTNKQYTYYACEFSTSSDPEKKCDFMTWDVPTKDDCPECGQTMFKKAGKGFKRPYCINPACSRFVPEDQRGYVKKKTTETAEEGAESAEAADAAETAAKKTAARKTTAKKSTTAKKTSTKAASTKKTATKTAAAKKTTKKAAAEDGAEKPAKKMAAKKTATTKKAAAKKTTTKSAAKKTTEKEEN